MTMKENRMTDKEGKRKTVSNMGEEEEEEAMIL